MITFGIQHKSQGLSKSDHCQQKDEETVKRMMARKMKKSGKLL